MNHNRKNRKSTRRVVTCSALLPKIIYEKKWQKRLEQHAIFNFWDSVAGPDIASHARPCVIHGRTLWLEVSDAIWMQNLNYMKYELIQKINAKLHPEFIEDIRYRQASGSFEKKPRQEERPRTVAPDPKKKEQFEEILEVVGNQAAKKALNRLWLAFASHEKANKE